MDCNRMDLLAVYQRYQKQTIYSRFVFYFMLIVTSFCVYCAVRCGVYLDMIGPQNVAYDRVLIYFVFIVVVCMMSAMSTLFILIKGCGLLLTDKLLIHLVKEHLESIESKRDE